MRILRPALVLAAVLGAATVSASVAAPAPFVPPQLTDTAGDSNGINGQGFTHIDGTSASPNFSQLDILTGTWSTDKKGTKAKNLTVKLAVQCCTATASGDWRVTFQVGSCAYVLDYVADAAVPGPGPSTVKNDVTACGKAVTVPLPTIGDGTIIWSVPLAAAGLKVGAVIDHLAAVTKQRDEGVDTFIADEAASGKTYKIGS